MPRKKKKKEKKRKKVFGWFNFPNNFRTGGFYWIYFMEL
jgi:hypothetical protein